MELHFQGQDSQSRGQSVKWRHQEDCPHVQRAGLCDSEADLSQLNLPASLSYVQAAEKKLQELQASAKQSEDAEAQVSGLKKELEQVQATLRASKDAAKAADSEKVWHETHL